jgi:CheY-like chemotaxis protein
MPTVLLIEDDAEARKRVARLFARHEWNVLEADDGMEGMEIAFAQKPEAIICDLLLPKLSGLQVCRTLREKLHSTRIIIIAGRHYDVDRKAILEMGEDREGPQAQTTAAPETDPTPITRAQVPAALDAPEVLGRPRFHSRARPFDDRLRR